MSTKTLMVEIEYTGTLDNDEVEEAIKIGLDDFAQDNYGKAQIVQIEDVFVGFEDNPMQLETPPWEDEDESSTY